MKLNKKTCYTNFVTDLRDEIDIKDVELTEEIIKEYISNYFDTCKIDLIRSIEYSFIDSLEYTEIKEMFISVVENNTIELNIYTQESNKQLKIREEMYEAKQKAKPTKEERKRIKEEKELAAKKALFLKLKEELGE